VTAQEFGGGAPVTDRGTAPVLEVRGISKAFGHVQALWEVSFELYPAEVVALLGDNGAGKSSLVKILSGVYQPDDGDLFMDGQPLAIRAPTDALRHGIGTVYQDLAVVDSLDVARNIYLGNIPRRLRFMVDYARMYADSRRILSLLRVDMPSVRTRVGELSGGQRQAVAIARTLAQEARIFLMDEPTAALGVAQTEKVNELITDLKDQRKTVLLISHNLEHVFSIADRLIVLRHGRRVAIRLRNHTSREEIVGLITGAIEGDTGQHDFP
jgi:ABC-type sugar transport system ATPase subunit